MSREIKFRVWDKEQQRMIAVPSLHFGDDGSGRTTTLWTKTTEGRDRLLVIGENAELMQYTQLKDRRGKDICEGDILRFSIDGGQTLVVEWEFNYFHLKNVHHGDRMVMCADARLLEIVGNIWETPDLLVTHGGETQ